MSGLFGYFDPENELPSDTAEQMARPMGCPSDRSTVILRGPTFAIGCVSKHVYPGEGEILASEESPRKCLFTGCLLSFSDQEESVAPDANARTAFVKDASDSRLASSNGSFAAAVWNEADGELELITDRYGMYPLYTARRGAATLFAAQMKALLATDLVSMDWDPVAVSLMLSIGELVGNRTLLQAIQVLPAGSKTVFSRSGERTTRYWHYSFSEEETDIECTAPRLGSLLRAAVGRVCHVTERVGVPLSGGLDSRVLLASTPQPSRVPSFTWGLAGCRDLRYASEIAQAVGSPHHAFVYDGAYLEQAAALGVWITEGQLPCTDFHVLPYVGDVAERCNVILNGYAGDVVLGGNFTKRPWWMARNRQDAGAALWNWRDCLLAESYRGSLTGVSVPSLTEEARRVFVDSYLHAPGRTPMDAAAAFLLDNRVRRFTACGTSLMRWCVESEQPFFDNALFDLASRIPHAWRFRHRLYAQILRVSFKEVAHVRWQRTGLSAASPYWLTMAALAAHRLDRFPGCRRLFRSRRVSDFNGWMRGPLRCFVTGLLTNSRTLDRGLYDTDSIRRIVTDHMSARSDNSAILGVLMSLELFARLFMDHDRELIDQCCVAAPDPGIVSGRAVA